MESEPGRVPRRLGYVGSSVVGVVGLMFLSASLLLDCGSERPAGQPRTGLVGLIGREGADGSGRRGTTRVFCFGLLLDSSVTRGYGGADVRGNDWGLLMTRSLTARGFCWALACACAQLAIAALGAATAMADSTSATGDESVAAPTAWYAYSGLTPSQITQALGSTNRLVDLRQDPDGRTYSVTMVTDGGAYAVSGWWWYYEITASKVSSALSTNNARLISVDRNPDGTFDVIMVSNTGAAARSWWWYYGQTPSQISTALTSHNGRLVSISADPSGSGPQTYTVVMVSNTASDAKKWWWYYGASASHVTSLLSTNQGRLVDIAREPNGTFDVIMVHEAGADNLAWKWYYGSSPSGISSAAVNTSFRVFKLVPYASGGGTTYAGLMIYNGPAVSSGVTGTPLARLCSSRSVVPRAAPPGVYGGGAGGMPAPSISFVGTHQFSGINFGGDISGAAGPNNYVETVNDGIGIFNRAGQLLCPEVDTQTLWNGSGGPCDIPSVTYTDAIVLYDQFAKRWFISRFINANPSTNNASWYQCVAVSQSTDPTAGYWRYAFKISSSTYPFFNDYPKFGIWRDAYYMTADANKIFRPGGTGIYVVAFQRSQMLLGKTARQVEFFVPRQTNPSNNVEEMSMMQPASVDGSNLPPSGSPEYLLQSVNTNLDWPKDALNVWDFHVNWTSPAASTLHVASTDSVQAFDANLCEPATQLSVTSQSCIPQPGTAQQLDPVAYGYTGYRLVYRSFPTPPTGLRHQVMAFAQTVSVGNNTSHAGIRWYILGDPAASGGAWTVLQQGTYAPDALDRWLPSPGIDAAGDLAIGFQVGGSTLAPSAGYVGRLASDPPNTLPRHEARSVTGVASQTDNSEFGDYTQMTMDPTDDCRFWYAAEYYPNATAGGSHAFRTSVASFRFPSCKTS
jgi:hypothetical protein